MKVVNGRLVPTFWEQVQALFAVIVLTVVGAGFSILAFVMWLCVILFWPAIAVAVVWLLGKAVGAW